MRKLLDRENNLKYLEKIISISQKGIEIATYDPRESCIEVGGKLYYIKAIDSRQQELINLGKERGVLREGHINTKKYENHHSEI